MVADGSLEVQDQSERPSVENEIPGFVVSWLNTEGEQEQGPLSALWHLIESYQIDIFDISLRQITEDFMAFLKRAEDLRIELASSFAVMAARLLYYKSRALLPDPGFEESDGEDRLPPELIQQLLEYRKFQLAAGKLRNLEEVAIGMYVRTVKLVPRDIDSDGWLDVSLGDLIQSYAQLLNRLDEEDLVPAGMVVDLSEYSVEEKMETLRVLLTQFETLALFSLMQRPLFQKRGEVIVTFLAILELVRQKEALVRQRVVFGDIELTRREATV